MMAHRTEEIWEAAVRTAYDAASSSAAHLQRAAHVWEWVDSSSTIRVRAWLLRAHYEHANVCCRCGHCLCVGHSVLRFFSSSIPSLPSRPARLAAMPPENYVEGPMLDDDEEEEKKKVPKVNADKEAAGGKKVGNNKKKGKK